jgi:cytochrome P450
MEVECEMQPTVVLPARIDPPAEPLSLLRLLHAVSRNPIESWPRAVYREDLYRSRMPGRDAVFVMHPALIRQVLVDEADAFEKGVMARRALEPVLGDAILIAEGARWRWQRRAAAPLFRREQLLQFLPAIIGRCWTHPRALAIASDWSRNRHRARDDAHHVRHRVGYDAVGTERRRYCPCRAGDH